MPLIARGSLQDDVDINHNSGTTKTAGASTNVFLGGYGVHLIGHLNESHQIGDSTHSTALAGGSSSVFVNGIGVGRQGDAYTCGATIGAVSQTEVFAG